MKSGNKVEVSQDGWRVEKLTQWPVSASYHHCGWCTSTDKEDFDEYIEDGDLWVVFKPKDRPTRPSYQIYIQGDSTEVMGKGNSNSSLSSIRDSAPFRVADWLLKKQLAVDVCAEAKRKERESRQGALPINMSRQHYGRYLEGGHVNFTGVSTSGELRVWIRNPPARYSEELCQQIISDIEIGNLNGCYVFESQNCQQSDMSQNLIFGSLSELHFESILGSSDVRQISIRKTRVRDVDYKISLLVTSKEVAYSMGDLPTLTVNMQAIAEKI